MFAWPPPESTDSVRRVVGLKNRSHPRSIRVRTKPPRRRNGTDVDAKLEAALLESKVEEGMVIT